MLFKDPREGTLYNAKLLNFAFGVVKKNVTVSFDMPRLVSTSISHFLHQIEALLAYTCLFAKIHQAGYTLVRYIVQSVGTGIQDNIRCAALK
jgi:hypothetical protein